MVEGLMRSCVLPRLGAMVYSHMFIHSLVMCSLVTWFDDNLLWHTKQGIIIDPYHPWVCSTQPPHPWGAWPLGALTGGQTRDCGVVGVGRHCMHALYHNCITNILLLALAAQ